MQQRITVKNVNPQNVNVNNKTAQKIGAKNTNTIVIDADPYEGEYNVVPSNVPQTLETQGKRMTANVVIEPIPQNYGLITWDGSMLTVS